ncbi:MAG: hypothetical protein LBM98_11885 [Oscillospiraceae bacterium]|nr:hypothetical protein [Oscillospiraceae bacterium]
MRSTGKCEIREVYRCEAIQCREDNIRPTCLGIAGYYVNPGLLRRVSMVRIASAVAASQ